MDNLPFLARSLSLSSVIPMCCAIAELNPGNDLLTLVNDDDVMSPEAAILPNVPIEACNFSSLIPVERPTFIQASLSSLALSTFLPMNPKDFLVSNVVVSSA